MILDLNLIGRSGLDVLEYVRNPIRRNGAYVFYKPGSVIEIDATLRRLLAG